MSNRRFSQFKFIPNPFYGGDAIHPQLLPDLADVHINSAVANDYIIAPHLVQYFVAEENTAGF